MLAFTRLVEKEMRLFIHSISYITIFVALNFGDLYLVSEQPEDLQK